MFYVPAVLNVFQSSLWKPVVQ